MELQGYLAMVRARWRVVAAVAALGTILAAAVSAAATPVYESRAKVFFSVGIDPTPGSLARGLEYSQGLVSSYADIAATPFVLDPVIRQLDLRTTPDRLARSVSVQAPADSVLLEVTAVDSSPQQAARIASAVAGQLAVAAGQITPRLATQPTAVRGTTVAPAPVPRSASYPYTRLNLAVGLLLGLLVGVAAAIAAEVRDPRLRERPQLAQVTEAPVLGTVTIPGRRRLPRLPRLPRLLPRPVSQRERMVELRANFDQLRGARSLRLVAVTSAADAAVASRAVSDLATALARRGVGVLVVDADLRSPTLGERYGADDSVGLSSVLTGQRHWTDSVQHFARLPLSVLPSGPPLPDPGAHLSSWRAAEVLAQLADRYGLVLVKAPPVLRAAEGLVLSHLADGTIVVTERGAMRRRSLVEVLDVLDVADVRVAGVVVGARR